MDDLFSSLGQTPAPLEDGFEDVLSKAITASGLTQAQLERALDLETGAVRNLRRGVGDDGVVAGLADLLGLHPAKLVALRSQPYPPPPGLPADWYAIGHPFGEGFANAYLFHDRTTRSALLWDCGLAADRILAALAELDCDLGAIFLTHRHRDHVGGLSELRRRFPAAPVYVRFPTPDENFCEIDPGNWRFSFAGSSIRAFAVPGHSRDGTCFLVRRGSQEPSVFISGDVLFAGSIGGIREVSPGLTLCQTLTNTLQAVEMILSDHLSPEDYILPGHGPVTTVANEQARNPFLREFVK